MALYVVVHHNRDANQLWVNGWLDDERLEAIQTTRQIGGFCSNSRRASDLVFVHRCGWGEFSPAICCSASVAQVGEIDHGTSLVSFANQQVLNATPPVTVVPGQNYYFADRVN